MSVAVERVVLLGDVGGHLGAFTSMIGYFGVEAADPVLPPGLTVVQVGDLVHKGPDSEGCVDLAGRLLDRNPGRYVQLVGNHEAHYLGGPDVTGRDGVHPVPAGTRERLLDWWEDGTLRVACSVSTDMGGVLVTHGGLTSGFHAELGAPVGAADAVSALESMRTDAMRVFRPGSLMTGLLDRAAGVICPRTGSELCVPWLARGRMPFTQVHGHEGLWWWPNDGWHDDVPLEVRSKAVVDRVSRQSWLDVGEHRLWSIDPVFGIPDPPRVPVPLVLPGRIDS